MRGEVIREEKRFLIGERKGYKRLHEKIIGYTREEKGQCE